MRRFYYENLSRCELSDEIALDPGESRHIQRVLRLQPGDRIELFDGLNTLAKVTITPSVKKDAVTCSIETLEQAEPEALQITIASAIPKGSHADDMLAAMSQLGVTTLVPLQCERSVVEPNPGKLDRFKKAALESAKQCKRLRVMQVSELTPLGAFLQTPGDVKFIADAEGSPVREYPSKQARQDATTLQVDDKHILGLVGPEGGFTEEEVKAAIEAGFQPVCLGPNILRTEVASSTLAAALRFICS